MRSAGASRRMAPALDQTLTPQVLEDRTRRGRLVERIEMNSGSSGAQELGTLPRPVLDAEREPGLRIVAGPLERLGERGGHRVARQLRDALDLARVRDRHDARHERHADARSARALDEAEVVGVVVEQLRDDDIEAGVDLLLQMPDAQVEIAGLGMALRMSAADQAERMAALSDEADQIDGVPEAVARGDEAGVLRNVAPDGDEVLDAARQHEVAVSRDLVAAGLDGGDVDRAFDPEPLDALDDRDRRFAGPAAGAGHRHEGRTQGPQRVDRAQERRLALRGARWEELEGDERAALVKQLLDLHAGGSTSTSPSSPAP